MVALYSVTTAGPEYFLPGRSASREMIAAGLLFSGEKDWREIFKTAAGLYPARTGEGARPHMAGDGPRLCFACFDLMVARRRSVTSSTSRLG